LVVTRFFETAALTLLALIAFASSSIPTCMALGGRLIDALTFTTVGLAASAAMATRTASAPGIALAVVSGAVAAAGAVGFLHERPTVRRAQVGALVLGGLALSAPRKRA